MNKRKTVNYYHSTPPFGEKSKAKHDLLANKMSGIIEKDETVKKSPSVIHIFTTEFHTNYYVQKASELPEPTSST